MNTRSPTARSAVALMLALGPIGCGAPERGANASPRATDDPRAYERATAQAAQADREAREAEAAALGTRLRGLGDP